VGVKPWGTETKVAGLESWYRRTRNHTHEWTDVICRLSFETFESSLSAA
jgi:hypothetical protein